MVAAVRRRVWCETLSFAELSPALLEMLAARHIELLLAVRPWQLAEVADTVVRARAAGVYTAVWPMVGDDEGRWASVYSLPAFVAFADEVLARAPDADEIVIDLEPPHAVLARWKELRPARQRRFGRSFADARDLLAASVARWRAGRRVSTALLPLLVLERGQWMQRALGTPATTLPIDSHNVMAYSSLYEGWSRGLVNRRRAEQLLALTARLTRLRFGARSAVSLGCVGPGAFGDEPGYRGVDELYRDVAIARAAGIAEVALFDLGGVVRRGDVSAWLDALA